MFDFKTSIVFSVVILIFSVLICDGRHLNGSIRPLNPILTNKGVNISCSLPAVPNPDGISSRHLYFSPSDLTPSSPIVVDERTINLTLSDISRFHNHVNIFCYANVSGEQHYVAQSKIIVVEPLVAPILNSCIIHNWSEMVCEIDSSELDFGVKTDVNFMFSPMCMKKFFRCPSVKSGRCEFKYTTYQYYKYCVMVCFNNSYDKACSNVTLVKTEEAVKPGLVKASSIPNSRFADVILTRPFNKDVMFYVEVMKTGKVILAESDVNASTTTVRLEGLRPNTRHFARVKCISVSRKNDSYVEMGYFSDPFPFDFITLPDVPDENPKLLPGSFYFDPSISPDGKTYVTIFWKKIPKASENGLMNHTGITYWEMGRHGEARREHCDPDESSIQLKWQLDRSKDYVVEVVATNERGVNHEVPPSRVVIPSSKRASKFPEHLHATLVNNTVQLKWSAVEGADDYTVYWCHLHYSTRKCHPSRDMEWKSDIAHDTTELVIPVTLNDLDLKVGMSVDNWDSDVSGVSGVVSSGVVWSRCISRRVADVLPPTNFHFSPHQTPHSLTIMWSHPECSETSYISGYEIFWCKLTLDVCLEKDNDTHCCQGNSSSVVPRSMTSWTIVDLDPDAEYEVAMRSSSFERTSEHVEGIRRKVLDTGYNRAIWILIITAIILSIIICPIVVFTIVRKLHKFFKSQVKFTLPPGGSLVTDLYHYEPSYTNNLKQFQETQIDNPSNGHLPNGTSGHSNISLYTKTSPLSPPIQPNPPPSYPLQDGASLSERVALLHPVSSSPSSSPSSSSPPLPPIENIPSYHPPIPDYHRAVNISPSSPTRLDDGAGDDNDDAKKIYDDDIDDKKNYDVDHDIKKDYILDNDDKKNYDVNNDVMKNYDVHIDDKKNYSVDNGVKNYDDDDDDDKKNYDDDDDDGYSEHGRVSILLNDRVDRVYV